MPDNFWRSGAVYSTVPGYYATAKCRWIFTVRLPYAVNCKHFKDLVLVSFVLTSMYLYQR